MGVLRKQECAIEFLFLMLHAVDYMSVGTLEEDDELIEVVIVICRVAVEDVVELEEIVIIQIPLGVVDQFNGFLEIHICYKG